MSAPFPPEPDRDILESSPRWGRAGAALERVPRWLMLIVAVALLAGGGTVLALSRGGHATPGNLGPAAQTVSVPATCDPFDDSTSSRLGNGFRVVLGDIAVSPVRFPLLTRVQALRPPGAAGPWRYEWKTEFAYRGDRPPVTISVPAGWQRQISLAGAADGSGSVARALHIPSCPPRGSWNMFFRIFYVSTPAACAPLRVQAAGRTATFWFGFGARCRAGASTGQGRTAVGTVLIPPGCRQSGDGATAQDRRGFRILVGGGTEQLGLGARCPAAVSGRSAARR